MEKAVLRSIRLPLWVLSALILTVPLHAGGFGLKEPTIYPAGFPTAETLRKGEWMFAPPPWGWVAYGANDRWTLAWDYPAALFGYIGFMTRIKGVSNERWKSSLEFYIFGIPTDLNDDRQDGFRVVHGKGWQGWAHWNNSLTIAEPVRLHLYAGANYKHRQEYQPRGSAVFEPTIYRRHVNTDAGIDLELRLRPWVRMHTGYQYGNTFYFIDQVAMKSLWIWSFHFAPLTNHRLGILRNLRFSLNALWVSVPDANYKDSLPVPLYPVAYWQWGGK